MCLKNYLCAIIQMARYSTVFIQNVKVLVLIQNLFKKLFLDFDYNFLSILELLTILNKTWSLVR